MQAKRSALGMFGVRIETEVGTFGGTRRKRVFVLCERTGPAWTVRRIWPQGAAEETAEPAA